MKYAIVENFDYIELFLPHYQNGVFILDKKFTIYCCIVTTLVFRSTCNKLILES